MSARRRAFIEIGVFLALIFGVPPVLLWINAAPLREWMNELVIALVAAALGVSLHPFVSDALVEWSSRPRRGKPPRQR